MRVERLIEQNSMSGNINKLKDYVMQLLKIGNGTTKNVCKNTIEVPAQMIFRSPRDLEESVYNKFL